jgi:RimJ/RimL family protein N-acetyltransferase
LLQDRRKTTIKGILVITVRRIQSGEADLLKQVRLAALQDSPYAFGTTYELAIQRSAEFWHENAERTSQGPDRATFFVFSDDTPVGMAALFRTQDQVNVGELLQVWVSPEHRGTSATQDLMDTVFKWAEENNFHKILAGVTRANTTAMKFYIKYGFSVMEAALQDPSDRIYLAKEVK